MKAKDVLKLVEKAPENFEAIKLQTYKHIKQQFVRDLEDRVQHALKKGWTLKDWTEARTSDPLIAVFARYLGVR